MALSLQRYTREPLDLNRPLYHLLIQRIKTEQERSKSVPIATKNGDRLPESLLIEILSWLPVKELLQYKSVCKSWYAIISSSQFISKHLKNNHNNNQFCLLAQYHGVPGVLELYELFVDETPRVLAYEVLYEMSAYGSRVCGPCDGLYYLSAHDFRALWNPAINELITLPPLKTKRDPSMVPYYSCHDFYGFGLDPVNRDYKVVVIKEYWSGNDANTIYPLSVLVYSVSTGSWKYCGDLAIQYSLYTKMCSVFVKGCCFWLAYNLYTDKTVIVSFDLASDTFQEIDVPHHHQPASNSLGVCDDFLAFFSVEDDVENLDIWTLNHGIWTKKCTIGPILGVQRPIGHWNNKVLVECEGWKLVLCDPNTREVKDLAFSRNDSCEGIFAYMESLVSIEDKNKTKKDEDAEKDLGIRQRFIAPWFK